VTTTVVLERDIAAEAGVGFAALHEEEAEAEVFSASDMTDDDWMNECSRGVLLFDGRIMIVTGGLKSAATNLTCTYLF
jgi:hypothetical protein